jgi:hypothetical protein
LFAGQTVFCLASGPSLADVDLTRLRGRRIITVNSSCHHAASAGLDGELLYFGDETWYRDHLEAVEAWPGMIVTRWTRAKRLVPRIKLIQMEQRPDFPINGAPSIRKGRSSGHAVISLAVAMGAARIVLLGYDMRVVDGRSHCHDDYSQADHPDLYATEFLPHFDGWNAAALARNVNVVNATPDSALTEFEFTSLEAELAA